MCYTYYFRLSNFCLFLTSGHSLDTMTFASKSYHTWQFPTLRGGAPSPQPPPILWQICISFKNQTSVTCHFGWPKPPPMVLCDISFWVRWFCEMIHVSYFKTLHFTHKVKTWRYDAFCKQKAIVPFKFPLRGESSPPPRPPPYHDEYAS